MYSVLNKLSEHLASATLDIHFQLSKKKKKNDSNTFLLVFKIVECLQCILKDIPKL